MVKTVTENIDSKSGPVERIRLFLQNAQDPAGAASAADLLKKADADELTIAFCGHFSAGKSSLINSLCGKKVLPSGPVPTSANVVSIRSGEARALIYRSGQQESPLEVSPAELAEYCVNGGQYTAVEVWDHLPVLEDGGVLLDTPGVDSTDRGHALATDSALHLADVVFYVMDYNHVQSENNLTFAKSLSDWGKPLYLIVNQIDKHRERELSFADYRKAVEESFKAWQVRYTDILFTSLTDRQHPLNQRASLEDLIRSLIGMKETLISHSVRSSLRHLAERHIQAREAELEEGLDQLLDEAGGAVEVERQQAEYERLKREEKELERLPEAEQDRLRRDLNQLMEQANLTPAVLRDAASAYLESRKSGFKVGLFFGGGKTEKERQRRLDRLTTMLQEQADGQLLPHVRSQFRSFGELHDIWDSSYEEELSDLHPMITEQFVADTVQESALSPEYTLNYCKDLRAGVVALYRSVVRELTGRLLEQLTARASAQRAALADGLTTAAAALGAAMQAAALRTAAADHAAALRALLPPADGLAAALPRAAAPAAGGAAPARPVQAAVPVPVAQRRDAAALPAAAGRQRRLADAAVRLEAAAALAAPYPAMQAAVRGLRDRARSLAHGRFTLALFGAFSAGKSSFANALLGEAVLPVSPHPTTAAINRIMAPEGDRRHRTAAVHMKSPSALREDLEYSFRLLGVDMPADEEWLRTAEQLRPEGVHPAGRPHYSFIKAAAAGWKDAAPLLGQVLTVEMEEYRGFVAAESKSCFVDRIDLYYDCALTRQGIVLVDTPGADSVNARHTGVTFNYMKHADALVFVTYYNHAFTQGDRQFLTQLGRVKDTLVLDQTFFIVNAADLASSEEELQAVVGHVATELQSNGIRKPRIFPVSSLLALDGREKDEAVLYDASRFKEFEQSFHTFAGEELAGLSIRAANSDIQRVRVRMEQWAKEALAGLEERGKRLLEVEAVLKLSSDITRALSSAALAPGITAESDELLYHVRQRIAYRTGEFMAEAFHPSVLREGEGDLRSVFAACGRELLRLFEIELSQELLATTLRLEKAGKAAVMKESSRCCEEINSLLDGLDCMPASPQEWKVPELEETSLQGKVDWRSYWSFFKNPKHFFEGAGRRLLQEKLEPLLRQFVADEATRIGGSLAEYYINCARQERQQQAEQIREQIGEALEGMKQSLIGSESPEQWTVLAARLAELEQENV
ncbi:dynamin family protein [Paenibacillus sp. P96]|uniref:Dynamin family protein n=1 Tax=Paenibacillus zeirhizosphaerae TaxID=2987519 RepID=A0ABT9FPB7_9BACL|nr:dynamin family protein [Paenibacillus sp. P96]MDP4096578.1 dynamin family protein [Paenibacillus sp. P96]